jgi:hypothetical protein
MTVKIGLWGVGAVLGLHLLACSQGGKVQGEKVTRGQDPPAHLMAMQRETPSPQPEMVSSRNQEAGVGEEAVVSTTAKNSPPQVVSVALDPADRIHHGVDITAIPKGADPDGDEVSFRYQWVINGVESLTEDSPVLRGDRYKRDDRVSVKVIPFDGEEAGEAYKPLPIVIPNAPPRFTSTPPMEFKSLTYTYQAAAEDSDGDPITFSLTSAPEGMTIDPETGRIDWTITRDDVGDHTIEVSAEDGFGGKAFQKYTLSIAIP